MRPQKNLILFCVWILLCILQCTTFGPNYVSMDQPDFTEWKRGYPSFISGLKFDFLTNDAYAELPGSFSDDGKYASFVYGENKAIPDSLRGTLWIINIKTKEKKQLTIYGDVKVFHVHDWCSAQNKIVFTGYHREKEKKNINLYTIDVRTRKIEQITHYQADMATKTVAWSYDGKYIAFALENIKEEQFDLMIMNYMTRKILPLTHTPKKNEIFPMWDFTGKRLFYLSIVKGKRSIIPKPGPVNELPELWVINLDSLKAEPQCFLPRKVQIKNYENDKDYFVMPTTSESGEKYTYLDFDYPTMAGNGDYILCYPNNIIFFDIPVDISIQCEYSLDTYNGFPKLSPLGDKYMYCSFRKNYSNETKGTPDLWIVDISELVQKVQSREWATKWLYRPENRWLWEGVDKEPTKMEPYKPPPLPENYYKVTLKDSRREYIGELVRARDGKIYLANEKMLYAIKKEKIKSIIFEGKEMPLSDIADGEYKRFSFSDYTVEQVK